MKYLTPELEVITFEGLDVLTTSTDKPETNPREGWETLDKVPFEFF